MIPEYFSLNPGQQLAVKTVNGRVLILAGAGSGKTKVLTVRLAHLIADHDVSPQSLLGLTFTNKAASEMRQRVASFLTPKQAQQLTLCTFHSFCMRILRKEIEHLGYTKHFSLYDEYDVQRLIIQICKELLNHESTLPSLAPTVAAINVARSQGVEPQELNRGDSQWHAGFTQDVYKKFVESMRAYNAVDFDNLLLLTVKLFQDYPNVLERYQEQFRFIMIDEYQDTNPIQYQLAALLSAKYGNLCVVGDDDQSIYGWRGAAIRNILDFDNAVVIKLEQNYRSTNVILKTANAVIRHNQKRHDKQLWSEKGDGTPIEIFHAPTDILEAEAVVHRLAALKESAAMRWSDFAILYRSNSLARQFEMALLKYTWKEKEHWRRGIPYQVCGGEEYYERREVKDLMAYLRAIINPFDQEALLRIINLPRRGIGGDTLDKLTVFNRTQGIPLWNTLVNCSDFSIPEKAKQSIKGLIAIFEEAKKRFEQPPLHETVQWLIEEVQFKRAIEEEVKSDKMRAFKWENVQEFITAVAEYENSLHQEGRGQEISLHDFVTSTPLGQEKSFTSKQERGDRVTLMTFHSAKGLEFRACFLVGLEDHIIPHEKSLAETGIEEERRLMYVAITRAKEFLTCSMARQRSRMGRDSASKPSRFLSEMPKEFLNVTRWDYF